MNNKNRIVLIHKINHQIFVFFYLKLLNAKNESRLTNQNRIILLLKLLNAKTNFEIIDKNEFISFLKTIRYRVFEIVIELINRDANITIKTTKNHSILRILMKYSRLSNDHFQ